MPDTGNDDDDTTTGHRSAENKSQRLADLEAVELYLEQQLEHVRDRIRALKDE